MKLNTVQKYIHGEAAKIAAITGGRIQLEPVQKGCLTSWNLSLNGTRVSNMSTSSASAFIRGWQYKNELIEALKAIVDKSYLRPGKHEDCHVHPDLIEAGRKVLAKAKGDQ